MKYTLIRIHPYIVNYLLCTTYCLLFFTACQEEQASKPNNGLPFISTIVPAQGRVGNNINITGGNFSKNPQENQVFFNGMKAEVYVGLEEEMIVTVPRGATTGQVQILVPGYDTVQGPLFTIEQFLKPVLYWHNGGAFYKANFNDEGEASTQLIFRPNESEFVSYTGFEYDATSNDIYLVGGSADRFPLIQKIALNATLPQAETLYDQSDPVLQEIETFITNVGSIPSVLSRIVLDVEKGLFYASSGNGQIIKGDISGATPLQKIYDDNIINTSTVAGAELLKGMALTVGKTHLYWIKQTFDGTVNRQVSIMRTAIATNITEKIYTKTSGLQNALDLVIDETRNRLYITDDVSELVNGVNVDCIWQGSLDGSLPLKKIFAGDGQVQIPTAGLALDIENNQLYWVTSERDNSTRIVRADLDDENPRIDALVSLSGFEAISYFTLSFEEDNTGGREKHSASNGRGNGRSR